MTHATIRFCATSCLLLLSLSGCFSNVRPLTQLEAGQWMVGGSVQAPGTFIEPEVEAWARVAPADGVDVTVGVQASVPLIASEPQVGGSLELQEHVRLSDGVRLVLQQEGRLVRMVPLGAGEPTVHVKGMLASLFVFGDSSLRPYVGPKIGILSGMTTDAGSDFVKAPGRASEDGAAIFFAGASGGFEVGDEVPFILGIDLGGLIDAKGASSMPSASLGSSVGFKF